MCKFVFLNLLVHLDSVYPINKTALLFFYSVNNQCLLEKDIFQAKDIQEECLMISISFFLGKILFFE